MKRWHRDTGIGTGADDVLRIYRGGGVTYKIRDFPVTGITATGVGEIYYCTTDVPGHLAIRRAPMLGMV